MEFMILIQIFSNEFVFAGLFGFEIAAGRIFLVTVTIIHFEVL